MLNTRTKRLAGVATTAAAVTASTLVGGGVANADATTSSGPHLCTSQESLPTTYPEPQSSLVHTGSCTNVVQVSIARWGFDPPCAQVSPPGPESGALFPGAGQAPGYVC